MCFTPKSILNRPDNRRETVMTMSTDNTKPKSQIETNKIKNEKRIMEPESANSHINHEERSKPMDHTRKEKKLCDDQTTNKHKDGHKKAKGNHQNSPHEKNKINKLNPKLKQPQLKKLEKIQLKLHKTKPKEQENTGKHHS